MLEELFYIHKKTVEGIPTAFRRYLYDNIEWDSPHICITGGRGVGKTTMLLQHYREKYDDVEKCLYVSADNVDVSAIGLFNTAKEYFKYGGEALIIDEIHKYPSWQVELKNIIDTYRNKKILISGSSALELKEGKADLSRRVVYYKLNGMSIREYLILKEKLDFPRFSIAELLRNHMKVAQDISARGPILKYFKNYLMGGYYPFFVEGERVYLSKVLNIIEKVLYEDIAIMGSIKKSNIIVLKKILWLIATSAPFYVNIDKMSRELNISKEYIYAYLEYLDSAGLTHSLRTEDKGYKFVRKPEKIFMENTNLLYAINNSLLSESGQGVVRETFFVNQLKDSARITLSKVGDFRVADRYIFEIGGKGKSLLQITGMRDAYIAADRIEIGHNSRIPLYLFGFLY